MSDYQESGKCCLCGGDYDNYGNNPFPYYPNDNAKRCCTLCDRTKVIPARLLMMNIEKEQFSGEMKTDIQKLFDVFEDVKYKAAQTIDFFYNYKGLK